VLILPLLGASGMWRQGEKVDLAIKTLGIPFPETEIDTMQARGQSDNLWCDRMAELWGQKAEDWYPQPQECPTEIFARAGNVTQDMIDRMLRKVARRRRGGDTVEENPVWAWTYEFMEKSEEEKAAFEEKLAKLPAKLPPITVMDYDGKTVLTLDEVKAKYWNNPDWQRPETPRLDEMIGAMREARLRRMQAAREAAVARAEESPRAPGRAAV
jgi:hypothetical protein